MDFSVIIAVLFTTAVMFFVTGFLLKYQKKTLKKQEFYAASAAKDEGFTAGIDYANSQKRFGLKEALAVAKFVKDRAGANAVLGTVVGVLGFKNEVSLEAEKELRRLYTHAKEGSANIAAINEQIAVLRGKIVAESEAIANYDRMAGETQEIAERFGDLAVDLAIPAVPEKPAESIVDEEG